MRPQLALVTVLIFAATFACGQLAPKPATFVGENFWSPVQPITVAPVAPASSDEGRERIFVVVPAFGVTNQLNAPPMSAGAKFRLAERQAFDPFVWASTGIQAGMSEASNEFPAYGQGVAGYSRRYGAAMLDVVNTGFATAAFNSWLKQDPRYFRLGRGPLVDRTLYSMAQEFSCHGDNGKRQFNWSNVLGTFAGSALSNAYYPRANRGLKLTVNRAMVSLLWGFTGGLTDEFGPDVSQKLFPHRKPKPTDQPLQ